MNESLITRKLTKRFLLGLPEGVYLVSNVGWAPGQPFFAQSVAPARERASQWQAIVAAGVNNRLCHIYQDPANFMKAALEIPYACKRN